MGSLQHLELVQRIIWSLWFPYWERIYKIPVLRIGSLEAAANVFKQFLFFRESASSDEIEAEYKKRGLPLVQNLSDVDMAELLKDVLIWDELPIAELLKECEQRGLQCKVVQRRELIRMLIKSVPPPTPEPENPGAARFKIKRR